MITFLTRDQYNCLHITEDKQKENEFDWVWSRDAQLLQIIWRPENDPHTMISLIVEIAEYNRPIKSTVYYKILSDN